ncbi:N-6 DNA methylase [Candidatus Poribacteria bacterium]|nr:N-6 DNA methylase [Candidatus Poribacteria bacterium]
MNSKPLQQIESDRQAAQKGLDCLKSALERNAMGQYATPFPLALEIVKFVKENWFDATDRVRFLDPAAGTGAFFSALLHLFPKACIEDAVGIERDPQIASIARKLWGAWGLEVIEADFTQLPFPNVSPFNLHLVNPPYVRHHHLDKTAKYKLQEKTQAAVGIKLNGLAGLYCYFLLIAHRWLADDGFGVWLIPSEFMDVNYGEAVKRYLIEQVSIHHVHRFDPEDVQFDDALVSSTVLIFQKRQPQKAHEVTFSLGGTLRAPRTSARIVQRQLVDVSKWTSLPCKLLSSAVRDVHRLNTTLTIGDLFDIRRGLATGANEFFILRRGVAKDKKLPEQFLRPILPSPRCLQSDRILPDEDGHPLVQPSLVLLDCDLDEIEIEGYPTLRAYLDWGKLQGFADRYITRHRRPWFRQEERPAAPILCSYMARGKSENSGIRFFRNDSLATAPNVYLMLYPTPEVQRACEKDANLLDRLFCLLKCARDEHLLYEGRTYGGGLNKIEPKELARVPLPDDPLLEIISTRPKQLVLLESG